MFTAQSIGKGTLVGFNPDYCTEIKNFTDLFECTHQVLSSCVGNRTIVLGPITSHNVKTQEHNLYTLGNHAEMLAGMGWTTLNLVPFQSIVDELIKRMKITGYPHVILDEFTIPLIESHVFQLLHFRENYVDSLGASIEHDTALVKEVPIKYLP